MLGVGLVRGLGERPMLQVVGVGLKACFRIAAGRLVSEPLRQKAPDADPDQPIRQEVVLEE